MDHSVGRHRASKKSSKRLSGLTKRGLSFINIMKIQRISEELDFDRCHRFRMIMIVGDFVSFPNSSKFFDSEKVETL
jgi:ABC-type microcin C transport system permease subunit YejB